MSATRNRSHSRRERDRASYEGQPFDAHKYADVREELSRRFGGITAFTRAPAEGSSLAKGTAVHDEIIVFEALFDYAAPDEIVDRQAEPRGRAGVSRSSARGRAALGGSEARLRHIAAAASGRPAQVAR